MTIKTVAHAYRFDIGTAEGKEGFAALHVKLKSMGLVPFETHGGGLHYTVGQRIDGVTLTLETEHFVTDDQWNTAPLEAGKNGLRVFDWALDYRPYGSATIKQGYWLEQTEAMAEVRRNTMKCGYCGALEPAAKGYVFCPHCIGSEYLKKDDLPLTRMLPAGVSFKGKRAQLTEAEAAHLLPLWKEAQLHGHTERDKARKVKQRADIIDKASKLIENAQRERDGLLALMGMGVNLDNVIYYNHTGRFGFGWRTPVDDELLSDLLDIISEFAFPYDIKCADGRTLSGN